MADEGNYCRNPDGEPAPWCYTTDPDVRYELCDIPLCENIACRSNPCQHGGSCEDIAGGFKCTCKSGYSCATCETRVKNEEGDCRRSALGWEYTGSINTTNSNRTCQRWELDTPHGHIFNDLDAENYCRNPDWEPAPWCYTADPYKRWEYCDIPLCTTPAKEYVASYTGVDYFGTVRKTRGGIPCQKWSEQTPHSQSYGKLQDQDNYCRNPAKRSPSESFSWCYTVDPDVRWDFCDIPRC